MSYLASELLYDIPWAAFALIGILTIAMPAMHLILVLGRVLIGRAAGINWWVLGRIVPLGLAMVIIVPMTLRAKSDPTESNIALAELATIFLLVAAIVVPIALPLLQAYVQRLPRLGTALYTILAIVALPVAGALATEAALDATGNIERNVPVGTTVNIPLVFLQDQQLSDCKQSIATWLPEGFHSVADPVTGDRGYRPFFMFWVDMTLKATFLDFFEIYDCGVSDLSNNPKNLLVSSFVFIYRAFIELIVLATIALPFLGYRER
ncbi:MAG: hypothetical protein GC190_02515 [Alphaproteobacteria bacterium]|nr:hypothetical protein [Alphaproteobacteria bacterium]